MPYPSDELEESLGLTRRLLETLLAEATVSLATSQPVLDQARGELQMLEMARSVKHVPDVLSNTGRQSKDEVRSPISKSAPGTPSRSRSVFRMSAKDLLH